GAEAHRGVPQQSCIQALQRGAVLEQNVGGIFGLVNHLIIGQPTQKLLQMWISPSGERRQNAWPVLMGQSVGKTLGAFRIAQLDEGVIQALIGQAVAMHLARQPLVSVDINLDAERKPCLQPDMHEAEESVNEVEVNTQAARIGRDQLGSFFPVAQFKTGTLLDRGQDADEALRDPITGDNRRHLLLFACSAIQIHIGTTGLFGHGHGVLLDALGTGQSKGFKILQQYLLLPKKSLECARLAERQITFENNPIKTRQRALNVGRMLLPKRIQIWGARLNCWLSSHAGNIAQSARGLPQTRLRLRRLKVRAEGFFQSPLPGHSTVTLLARLRGLSTSQPRATAI